MLYLTLWFLADMVVLRFPPQPHYYSHHHLSLTKNFFASDQMLLINAQDYISYSVGLISHRRESSLFNSLKISPITVGANAWIELLIPTFLERLIIVSIETAFHDETTTFIAPNSETFNTETILSSASTNNLTMGF